jgi:hypothetical protein
MTNTLRVRFDGKVLIPEGPVDLPINRPLNLRVEPAGQPQSEEGPRVLEELLDALDQLPYDPDSPRDGAAQHDHYLYGTPKRDNS